MTESFLKKKEKQTHRNHGKKKQQPRKAKQKLMKKCTGGLERGSIKQIETATLFILPASWTSVCFPEGQERGWL